MVSAQKNNFARFPFKKAEAFWSVGEQVAKLRGVEQTAVPQGVAKRIDAALVDHLGELLILRRVGKDHRQMLPPRDEIALLNLGDNGGLAARQKLVRRLERIVAIHCICKSSHHFLMLRWIQLERTVNKTKSFTIANTSEVFGK